MEEQETHKRPDGVRKLKGLRGSSVLTRLGGRWRQPGAAQRSARMMLVAALLLPQVAIPKTIQVDGTDSTIANDGVCSLREAINNANSDTDTTGGDCKAGSGADKIKLKTDVTLTEVDIEDRGLPLVSTDITIEGKRHTIARDPAAPDFAIFKVVPPDGALTVNDATVSNGYTDSPGGGIWNNGGSLTMTNSTLSGNSGHFGGGMCTDNGGTATLVDCTISDNYSAFGGGVIISDYYSDPGVDATTATLTNTSISGNSALGGGGLLSQYFAATTVSNSTISGNSAARYGGGVYSFYRAPLTVIDSTVSGNTAARAAGGVLSNYYGDMTVINSTVSGNTAYAGGGFASGSGGGAFSAQFSTLALINSTISGNTAEGYGGGTYSGFTSSVALTNSTVVNNSAVDGGGVYSGYDPSGPVPPSITDLANTIVAANTGGECAGLGATNDLGNNFSGDGSCPGTEDLIVPGVDFDTTLADNGGPTATHALLDGSVAIDAAGVCGLDTDQRGRARDDGACDSGSYENDADSDSDSDSR